jgi:hypothetical protein
MSAFTGHFTIFHYDDLVCRSDRIDALCDNDNGFAA